MKDLPRQIGRPRCSHAGGGACRHHRKGQVGEVAIEERARRATRVLSPTPTTDRNSPAPVMRGNLAKKMSRPTGMSATLRISPLELENSSAIRRAGNAAAPTRPG